MKSLTWGDVPENLRIEHSYKMRLTQDYFDAFAEIVNQGIDSHLEVVDFRQDGRTIEILDSPSMRCFLRRCAESDSATAGDIASGIMQTLGYEWV